MRMMSVCLVAAVLAACQRAGPELPTACCRHEAVAAASGGGKVAVVARCGWKPGAKPAEVRKYSCGGSAADDGVPIPCPVCQCVSYCCPCNFPEAN